MLRFYKIIIGGGCVIKDFHIFGRILIGRARAFFFPPVFAEIILIGVQEGTWCLAGAQESLSL